jgi:DNA sulfur modification protein DndD
MYSSDGASEATQTAIASVLGLTLLNRAQEDLDKYAIEVNKTRRRLLEHEEKGRDLAAEIQMLENNIQEALRQKNAIEEKCSELQLQENKLQDQLVMQESAQSLMADIGKLQEKIDLAEKNRAELAEEIKESTKTLYLEILKPILSDQLVEARRNRDVLMNLHVSSVRDEALAELFRKIEKEGSCICGRPADGQHLEALRRVLNPADLEPGSELAGNGLDDARLIVSQLEAALALCHENGSYAEFAARLADLENDIDEWATSLSAKKSQLGISDQEAIVSLTEELDRVQKEKAQAEREAGSLEKTISDFQADRKKLENRIKQLSGQIQGLDLLTAQVDILNRGSQAFGEIVRRSAVAKQNEIQDASTAFFQKITNKAFAYERMIINPDFSFGVETNTGARPPMQLISAGEKQVTALSFILGLNEYTRRQAPIFMDTPMGRLDETHRRNVARVLAEMANRGRQIILLVTDTDIAFGVDEILKPVIGANFDIVHDQTA